MKLGIYLNAQHPAGDDPVMPGGCGSRVLSL